ncbi:unnamed protein product [Musa acuminata subsp. burmannicoides]
MGYDQKLIRSSSRVKCRKLHLAFVTTCCCLVSVTLLVGYSVSSTKLSSWLWNHAVPAAAPLAGGRIGSQNLAADKRELKPVCDFADARSVVCELEGDIRIHGNSSSILFASSSPASWQMKPHPRKDDPNALSHVTQISVTSFTADGDAPRCAVSGSTPAIVFSTGGYMGNPFHDFTDVLIPLFITSFQFDGEVRFLVGDIAPWWIQKYEPILTGLSRHDIIDLNRDDVVRCFPHVIVGLRFHKEMSIDPSRTQNGLSMLDFGRFVRRSFALRRESATKLGADRDKKPRLLIIARRATRVLENVDQVARAARGLGFEVVVAEAGRKTDLTAFARLVNSCDGMMGVHGAGLANFVFLPMNTTLIQVVPLGQLDELARVDFGAPAEDMEMKYLQYRISEEESTLIERYPRDHTVFKDPTAITKQGWTARRSVYLLNQNVKIDVVRFRDVLIQALEFLHQE